MRFIEMKNIDGHVFQDSCGGVWSAGTGEIISIHGAADYVGFNAEHPEHSFVSRLERGFVTSVF